MVWLSTGAYSCVAKELAMMEIRAVVTHFVSAYDFVLSGRTCGDSFEKSGKDYYLMFFGDLWLRVTSRINDETKRQ